MNTLKNDIQNIKLRDLIAYTTSIIAFLVGFGLVIAGFIVDPLGQVDDSNLWILGEALSYTGAILGIGMYAHKQVLGIRRELGLKHEYSNEDGED